MPIELPASPSSRKKASSPSSVDAAVMGILREQDAPAAAAPSAVPPADLTAEWPAGEPVRLRDVDGPDADRNRIANLQDAYRALWTATRGKGASADDRVKKSDVAASLGLYMDDVEAGWDTLSTLGSLPASYFDDPDNYVRFAQKLNSLFDGTSSAPPVIEKTEMGLLSQTLDSAAQALNVVTQTGLAPLRWSAGALSSFNVAVMETRALFDPTVTPEVVEGARKLDADAQKLAAGAVQAVIDATKRFGAGPPPATPEPVQRVESFSEVLDQRSRAREQGRERGRAQVQVAWGEFFGRPREEYADATALLLRRRILEPKLASGPGSWDDVQFGVRAAQDAASSFKGMVEDSSTGYTSAILAALGVSAVAAGGVALVTKDPAKAAKAWKWAWNSVRAGAGVGSIGSGFQQSLGGWYEETEGDETFTANPRLRLYAGLLVAGAQSAVEAGTDLLALSAVLGVPVNALTAKTASDAFGQVLARNLYAALRNDPRGAVKRMVMDFGAAAVASAKAGGAEEASQSGIADLGKYAVRALQNKDTRASLEQFLGNAVSQGASGAIGEGIGGSVMATARITTEVALAQRMSQWQRTTTLLHTARALAKAAPAVAKTLDTDLVRDFQRMALKSTGTLYVEPLAASDAVDAAATKGGVSRAEAAQTLGLDLASIDQARAESFTAARIPVSFRDVVTKWAPAGALDTDLVDHVAGEMDGLTTSQATKAMDEVGKMREEEAAAKAEAAKSPREKDRNALIGAVVKATTKERQEEVYRDPVTGAYNSFALDDMAEDFEAQGFEFVIVDHEGQKPANDLTTHGTGNVLFGIDADALRAITPWVFKIGGSVVAALKAEGGKTALQRVQAITPAIEAKQPGKARVLATAGAFLRDANGKVSVRASFDKAMPAHRAAVDAARLTGDLAGRGAVPRALLKATRAETVVGAVSPAAARQMTAERARAQFVSEVKAAAKARKTAPLPVHPDLVAKWDDSPEAVAKQAERMYLKRDSSLLTAHAAAKLQKLDPHKHTVSLDMRGMGFFAGLGRQVGDDVIAVFGAVTGLIGGPDFRVTHLHGDEYQFTSNDPKALAKFEAQWKAIAERLDVKVPIGGKTYTIRGLFALSAQAEGTYDDADALANKTKGELDSEAEKIHRANEQAIKEGRPNDVQELKRGSKRWVSERLRLEIGDRAPGRDLGPDSDRAERGGADRLSVAEALRGRDSGQNLAGLVERLRAQQVGKSSAAILWRAKNLENDLRANLRAEPSEDGRDALEHLIADLRAMTKQLVDEAAWRLRSAVILTPDDVGAETMPAWLDDLQAREEQLSGTAIRLAERAAARIKATLDKARRRAEVLALDPAYVENRAKADPLYRLHKLLFAGVYHGKDGAVVTRKLTGVNGAGVQMLVEQGAIPPAVYDALKDAGRLTPDGHTIAGLLSLAGVDEMPNVADWLDVLDPPTDRKAALRASESLALQIAAMDEIESTLADANIGAHLTPAWFAQQMRHVKSNKRPGPGGTPMQSLKRQAHRLIAGLKRGDISLAELQRAEQRAAEQVMREAGRGDLEAAMVARERQLTYLFATQYGSKALEIHKKLSKKLNVYAKDDTLKLLSKGSPATVDFFGHVLNKFGKGRGRFPPDGLRALGEAIQVTLSSAAYLEAPFSVDLLESTLKDSSAETVMDLSTEQAENLLLAMEAVGGWGRFMAKVAAGLEAFETGAVTQEAEIEARFKAVATKSGGPGGQHSTVLTRLRDFRRGNLRGAESVADILGALSPVLEKEFMSRADEAVTRNETLIKEFIGGYLDLLRKHGHVEGTFRDVIPEDHVRTYLPLRENDPRDQSIHLRGWAVSMALNAGNKGNLFWLLSQDGWTYAQVQDFLNATLTEQEWAFVEDAWKFMDEKVYPHVAETYRRRNSFEMEKVEAVPMYVASLGRAVPGGYMPIRFDGVQWGRWRQENGIDELSQIVGPEHQGMVGTSKGFTKGRREFATTQELMDFDPMSRQPGTFMPLDLSMHVLPFHLEETAHYAAWEVPLIHIYKLSRSTEFQRIVDTYGGPRSMTQVDAWISDMARGRSEAWPAAIADTGRVYNALTHMTTAAFVGARIPLQATDLVNHVLPAIYRTFSLGKADPALTYSFRAWGNAFGRAHYQLGTMMDEAHANSAAYRSMTEDNEVEKIRGLVIKAGIGKVADESMVDWSRRAQWYGYEFTNRVVGAIAWHAKMLDAEARGLSHDSALGEANLFVHAFLMSHKAAYMSALQRKHRLFSEATRFQSFFFRVVGAYTRRALMPLAVEMVKAEGSVRQRGKVYAANGALLVGASLAGLAVMGPMSEWIAGQGPGKDEDFWAWFWKKALFAKMASHPLVGQAATGVVDAATGRQASMRVSPAMAAVQATVRSVQELTDDAKAGDTRAWAAVYVTLLASGLPAGQVRRSGEFTIKWLNDEVTLEDGDFVYGLNKPRTTTPVDLLRSSR